MLKNINVNLVSITTMYIVGLIIGTACGFFAGILILILVTLLSYFFKIKDEQNNIILNDDVPSAI